MCEIQSSNLFYVHALKASVMLADFKQTECGKH